MKGGPGLRREAQAPWAGLEGSLVDLTLGHEDVLVSAAAAGVAPDLFIGSFSLSQSVRFCLWLENSLCAKPGTQSMALTT